MLEPLPKDFLENTLSLRASDLLLPYSPPGSHLNSAWLFTVHGPGAPGAPGAPRAPGSYISIYTVFAHLSRFTYFCRDAGNIAIYAFREPKKM